MDELQQMAWRFAPVIVLYGAVLAWSFTPKRPALRTWHKWAPAVIPLVSFCPMLFVFGWNEIGLTFGALLVGQAVLMAMAMTRQPDVWTITGVSAAQLDLLVAKALSKSGVSPERTPAGLTLDDGVSLKISHVVWLGTPVGSLTWEPAGSWRHSPMFEASLRESLQHMAASKSTPPPLMLLQLALLALMIFGVLVLLLPHRLLDPVSRLLDEALRHLSQ